MKWLVRANLTGGRGSSSLGGLIDDIARLHGDRTLVTQPDGLVLSAREAAVRVARWAGTIAPQIAAGDRVVIATANGYEAFLLCLAASRAGGVAVPVNPKMTDREIEHVIADSGAVLVIRDPSEVALGDQHPALPLDGDEVAAIFYTSGTTGQPKGAELSHRSLLGSAAGAFVFPSEWRRDEAVVGLPVAHIMGFGVLASLGAAGIPVYFLPHFRPDLALDAIEAREATMFIGVPAMYRLLLEAGAETRNLKSIRVWASGADVMPPDLARQFQKFGATASLPVVGPIGEAMFVEGYGMVELGGGVAAKVSPPLVRLPIGDLLGVPMPPNRFRVVDGDGKRVGPGAVGELQIKGPGLLKGYHGDEAATRAVLTDDGWLRTGDLARRGPLGSVLFAGRSKDVIKVGGYSVYALEVQQALEEHPAVAEAAVLGIPDERVGERVVAAVRLKPAKRLAASELVHFANERLSAYKVPTEIRIVDELPRTGTDKVKKADLIGLFSERQ